MAQRWKHEPAGSRCGEFGPDYAVQSIPPGPHQSVSHALPELTGWLCALRLPDAVSSSAIAVATV
jgi:hypothetical protein